MRAANVVRQLRGRSESRVIEEAVVHKSEECDTDG